MERALVDLNAETGQGDSRAMACLKSLRSPLPLCRPELDSPNKLILIHG